MPSASHSSLFNGTSGLLMGYALVLVPMLVALTRHHAAVRTRWLAALWALPALLVDAFLIWIVSAALSPSSGVRPLLGVLVTLAVGYASGVLLARRPASGATRLRRGAVVVTAVEGAATASAGAGITLAGLAVPAADETKHFKLIGTTGTGKSTAIRELLKAALDRGDRAVIADPDGGYLDRFYNRARGDVILNPFDGDARRWDLFSEVVHEQDIEQLARSLIPDQGSDSVWPGYARTLFSGVAHQLFDGGARDRDDRELYRLLISAPQAELRPLLAGTVAGPFLEIGNEKMLGSVRSVMTSALGALDYTTRHEAEAFSVRQWVRSTRRVATGSASAGSADAGGEAPARGGVLFLPYKAGEIAALRSVISAWLRLAIFEAMDGEEGDARLWFVVDELDALGQIDGLKDALARLRKFGGRCVLGFQSIAQVSATYGKGNADTIVENCGNTLILRCSASEYGGTAEFASRLIGQREVIYRQRASTRNPGQWRPSVTSTDQLRTEPAVMAAQIERLPDLAGYLKLASVPDWRAVTLVPASTSDPAADVPRRVRRPSVLGKPGVPRTPAPAPAATPASTPESAAAAPKRARRSPVDKRANLSP